MITLHFSINIKKDAQAIWKILWHDKTYRLWAGDFSKGSYAESDWKEGSRVEFYNSRGLRSEAIIETRKENEAMIFRFDGLPEACSKINENGKIISYKKYILKPIGDITMLSVYLDIDEEREPYYLENYPKALDKIKQLAEQSEIIGLFE